MKTGIKWKQFWTRWACEWEQCASLPCDGWLSELKRWPSDSSITRGSFQATRQPTQGNMKSKSNVRIDLDSTQGGNKTSIRSCCVLPSPSDIQSSPTDTIYTPVLACFCSSRFSSSSPCLWTTGLLMPHLQFKALRMIQGTARSWITRLLHRMGAETPGWWSLARMSFFSLVCFPISTPFTQPQVVDTILHVRVGKLRSTLVIEKLSVNQDTSPRLVFTKISIPENFCKIKPLPKSGMCTTSSRHRPDMLILLTFACVDQLDWQLSVIHAICSRCGCRQSLWCRILVRQTYVILLASSTYN